MGQDSCSLYFAGCEVRQFARLTQEAGVEHVGVNFRYLKQRCNTDKFSIGKHFPVDQDVWLDSGTFGINREDWNPDLLEDFLSEYLSFAETNIGALTYVTEFDATPLGYEWIEARRNDAYGNIDPDKLVVVWHPEYGVNVLRSMVERFPNVAVPTLDKIGQARIHGLARSNHIKLMGLRLAHPFELPGGLYKAILSSSWISPAKYGETHVWDHTRMRRYSPKQKVQARKRHANDFKKAGFDADKIQNDDPVEVPRYTLWAWKQLEESLGRSRAFSTKATNGHVAAPLPPEVTGEKVDLDMTRLDTLLAEGAEILSRAHEPVVLSRLPALAEPPLVPGFGWRTVKVQVPDPEREGDLMEVDQRVVTISGASMRMCDSCSLNAVCPASEEGAACKFHMPVEIRSRDQLLGVLTAALELQWQRVAFGKFAEDLEGGYPNPNLSQEIDRLYKLVSTFKDISDNRDTFSLQIKTANMGHPGGILQKIFGQKATEPLREVDAEAAEEVIRTTFSR